MLVTDKIAILMATFNGEKYLEEQIDSLLAQTSRSWELFIHDDQSGDQTPEIIDRYAHRYPERIHILEGPACGTARDNFFYLMKNVRAPYLMFCDQDDVWMPEKIEKTLCRMKEMESQEKTEIPLLVFSDLAVADEQMNILAERMSVYQNLPPERVRLKNLMIQNVITGCTVMINRTLAELALKPEKAEGIIMHDWWCALAAACFGRIAYVDSALVLYRQHAQNSVGAKEAHSLPYLLTAFKAETIQQAMEKKRTQAETFIHTYDFKEKPLFEEFVRLSNGSRAAKLRFYFQHRIWMSGWQRNLGLLLRG